MSTKQEQFTYRNTSDQKQALIGVGEVEAGETITTFERVENPNFTLVTRSTPKKETPQEGTDQAEGQEPAEATQDVSNERELSEDEKAARKPKENK